MLDVAVNELEILNNYIECTMHYWNNHDRVPSKTKEWNAK
jgi:hypothetical protein